MVPPSSPWEPIEIIEKNRLKITFLFLLRCIWGQPKVLTCCQLYQLFPAKLFSQETLYVIFGLLGEPSKIKTYILSGQKCMYTVYMLFVPFNMYISVCMYL